MLFRSAVSTSGQPYTALPNAFRFRQEFNPTCSCRAPGQSWADALKGIDDKAAAEQQGDIIVTEESAKKMSRPLTRQATPVPGRKGVTTATVPAPDTAPAPSSDTAAASGGPSDNKTIRSVGPAFIQTR